MLQFPVLKTGAVAQYPLGVEYIYRADIVWFLDGSEQRFRNSPSVLNQWQINLDQLDEAEMSAIEQFFILSAGSAQTFAFTDPGTNTVYQNCSVAQDDLDFTYQEPLSSKTKVVIRQNRT